MKIYAIADLHLSFGEGIDKPMAAFGASWANHELRLRRAWEERISAEDIVLLPGDLSWGLRLPEALPDLAWIHELPGRKLLIRGNHDLWWARIRHLRTLYADMIFLQNDAYYIESLDIAVCGSRGWPTPGSEEYTEHDEKIYRREQLRLEAGLEAARRSGAGQILAMLHYPPAGRQAEPTAFTELLERYGVHCCVYGHLHGMPAYATGISGIHRGVDYHLVSLDYLDAQPRLIYDIEKGGWMDDAEESAP